jgi:peptidoglycan/xylan/chitin deacetylase (PgdA/CDA1 family)
MLVVLSYHNFTENYKGEETKLYVNLEHLKAQLNFIKLKFKNIIFLRDTFQSRTESDRNELFLAVTIDDGLKNFLKAYPLFKKFGIKVTLFVSGNKIGKTEYSYDLNKKVSYLEVAELRSLDRNIVDIQSHGFNHINLTAIEKKEVKREIKESKRILENLFKRKVDIFCYPYGAYNREIITILEKADYKGACTTISGVNQKPFNPFLVKRIPITSRDDRDNFRKKINFFIGKYEQRNNFS